MTPKLLLIRPLCAGDEPDFAEPLGLERLAGYLRAAGMDAVEVLDRRLYQRERRLGLGGPSFWQDVAALCDGEPPDLVCLSLMTEADVADALRVMSRMHARYPQARFQAGGVYVTTQPERAAALLPRDTILQRGEGEAALLALAKGAPVPSVPLGPDDWAVAHRPQLLRYARLGCAVNLQTSRGCPGSCTFCATPGLPGGLRRWAARSESLVADEMQGVARRLEEAGLPPVFNFVDDHVGPLARLERLADELDARDLRVAFSCEMRLAALIGQPRLRERLARLRARGLTRLFVGVESLNPRTLARWRKPYDVAALPEVVGALRAAGISLQTGYILWHAGQTLDGALEEARALHDLGLYTHQASVSRLIVFAGCAEAHDGATAEGYQAMGPAEEDFYQRFVARTAGLRARWTQAALRLPYAAGCAALGVGEADHAALTAELAGLNEASYRLLEEALRAALPHRSLGA